MSVTVHIHPGQFKAAQYTPGYAVVEITESQVDVAIFLKSAAMCDDLIKAAVAAKSILLGETSDPVLDAALTGETYRLPAGELASEGMCLSLRPTGIRVKCTLDAGHEGDHEAHGTDITWPQDEPAKADAR